MHILTLQEGIFRADSARLRYNFTKIKELTHEINFSEVLTQ